MDAKEIFLKSEGDAWYTRNLKNIEKKDMTTIVKYIYDFIQIQQEIETLKGEFNVLEVGCSYGYNLANLNELFSCKCFGIEPSEMAVADGKERYKGKNIFIEQGTGDSLPYESSKFDMVIMGFCMFWMDRKYLLRAYAEADRVLKAGGILVIHDFDTKIPYKRGNIHNKETPTYKMNYAEMLLQNPEYYLIEKRSYWSGGEYFSPDIQERVGVYFIYKEDLENAYVRA